MGKSNFKDFCDEIKFKRRNPGYGNAIFKDLRDMSSNAEIVLTPKNRLYRARVVTENNKKFIVNAKPFMGFSNEESLMPPSEKTRAARANYDYIPYLYCSGDDLTAIEEVRARLIDEVSVAVIQPKQDLVLLDLACDLNRMKSTKLTLIRDLSEAFSKKASEGSNPIDYIPTQYVAEFIRFETNYDGIRHKSAISSKNDGVNIILFDAAKCDVKSTDIYKCTFSKWKKTNRRNNTITIN